MVPYERYERHEQEAQHPESKPGPEGWATALSESDALNIIWDPKQHEHIPR